MNTKIIKFDLNKNLYDTLIAKQGDTKSRFLLFNLLDGSIPFSLENRSVRVYAIKPDRTEVFNDLIITDAAKGYCILELTTQMLAVAGTVKLELMVMEGDKKLTSNIFYMDVKESINSEKAVVSTNEFGTLLTALASLNEYDNYKNEIKNARGGEANLNARLNNFNEQLDNNVRESYEKIRTNVSERLYGSPVVTIVVDDGMEEFLTLVKPTLDKYNIIPSVAIIPNKVGTSGYMTIDQLKELQEQGYSILSHSYTHDANIYKPSVVDTNPISDDVILEDYRKCYNWMVKNNFNGADTIVYPWGYFTNSGRYKNLARTFFNNGINAYGGNIDDINIYGNGVNEEINDNMYLNRLFINKNTDIQAYKNAVDDCVSRSGWLILGSHSNNNEIDISHLEEIINYIKSKNILILPFNQANRLKGNAINVGDYTNDIKFFVSKRGKTSLPSDVITSDYTSIGENGYESTICNIKNINNITNGNIRFQSSNGTGVFTNQLKIGSLVGLPKLTSVMLVTCIITTWDSKVIVSACSLNQSGDDISVNCHGTLENSNIWRIDINFNYIA